MIKRILGKQSEQPKQKLTEQPKQQLTPAEVDGAESGNNDNETIRGFRYAMARVREAIEALTRRFGEWFATNSFFREISFAIATQTVIWLVVETLLLSTLERDFGKFCEMFETQLKNHNIPKGRVSVNFDTPTGRDNHHYHIRVYLDGVEVYSRWNLSPGKDHTRMVKEAARKVLQKWRELNPEANGQNPNTRKRR